MPRSQLGNVAKAIIRLYEKSPGARIKVRASDGAYIELDNREIREAIADSQRRPAVLDKLAFSESYQYLENAKARLDTKTAVGYSDCKANCRNALMSTLKTLTGKEEVSEAARELGNQGILGKREKEFTETFNKLLVILHGLDSKKGSHPPMTREEGDAELVLGITTSILNYVTNQAITQRD
jgi:hypothetical protein